tara:strand:- start:25707 stop:26936 length:1230 start_codon:yes stop_codon:yes gene_type:complete
LTLITGLKTGNASAQSSGYEVIPSPDLWYNAVDGIRLGINLKGQVPGTFEDGPHRLDAGVWLGLWFPENPLSYYIGYTEPISSWSEFGSEANIELISSVRTGYQNHGVAFNKRWQIGFDESRYREIRLYNSFEKRFNSEYTPFESLWSEENKFLTTLSAEVRDNNRFGWYQINVGASLQYLNDAYSMFGLSATQNFRFNDYWGLKARVYTGLASANTAPEYLHSRSMRPAMGWMSSGVTRAKGTIPQSWLESGNIQVAGGANVRGYTTQDIETFQRSCLDAFPEGICLEQDFSPLLFNSIASLNLELDYWNPIIKIFNELPYASEFMRFRSYLFYDAGRSLDLIEQEPTGSFSNIGTGFSLSINIPDYRGKQRGFVLRYELPFWLSDPVTDENSFKVRHLFGFGAIISL